MEAPEYFVGGYFGVAAGDHFSPEKQRHVVVDQKPGEPFAIDDLLDFSNADDAIMSDGFFDNNVAGNSADSSTGTAIDSCNSSISGADNRFNGGGGGFPQFSGELCVPVSHGLNLI